MPYFSVTMSLIALLPDPVPVEGYIVDIQVHLFEAEGVDLAFERALQIGRAQEHCYLNESGQTVNWVLKEIEQIRCIGDILSESEISSRMEEWKPEVALSSHHKFKPENNRPEMIIND